MKFDPSRSTPVGYWHFAKQYFQVAEAVRKEEQSLMLPALQLYGQSIELALKSFLLKRGETLERVESLRHKLNQLLALARRRRLGLQVKLSANDVALIDLLNENYVRHRFRYIVTGVAQVPQPAHIAVLVERLLVGLERYCANSSCGVAR